MTPYYERGGITLYHGDALEIMPSLSGRFAVTYTDPPFTAAGGATNGRVLDADTQFFEHWLQHVVDELRRCSAPSGCWLVHCDWRTIGSLQRSVARSGRNVRSEAWRVTQALHWHRGSLGMGSPFRNVVEMIAFAPGPEWTNRMPKDVATLLDERWPYGRKEHHGAEKPVALIERLLRLVDPSGGPVFDPFAGSGSTLLAARRLGRVAVGIEMDERYCEIAARRLEQPEQEALCAP